MMRARRSREKQKLIWEFQRTQPVCRHPLSASADSFDLHDSSQETD